MSYFIQSPCPVLTVHTVDVDEAVHLEHQYDPQIYNLIYPTCTRRMINSTDRIKAATGEKMVWKGKQILQTYLFFYLTLWWKMRMVKMEDSEMMAMKVEMNQGMKRLGINWKKSNAYHFRKTPVP